MAKNILILSDGTGQGASMPKARRSNVWKLWQASEKAAPGRQITFYDEGLGSEHKAEWWRWGYDVVSKATGLGISQNIKDCYTALIELHDPDDRIYLLGFSRGAYTVRSLGGVLSLCGIPRKVNRRDKKAVQALSEEAVEKVYKHYGNDEKTKQERKDLGRQFRQKYDANAPGSSDPPFPYFIGVWDTVRALGIPGSSGLVGWRHAFHDATLNPNVPYARQALSIDEDREIFEPVLWDETPADKQGRIEQRWFPGVHSDIGGGYAEPGLSDQALDWVIKEALAVPNPIIIDATKLALHPAFDGMQHDERTGWGNLWIEGTREKWAPMLLKETEVERRFAAASVPYMDGKRPYRPKALSRNATYKRYYP